MRDIEINEELIYNELIKEDIRLFRTALIIFIGMIMTILGIFTNYWEFMLPIGLPLWIISTVWITKDLTYIHAPDIVSTIGK
jgi:hypothetical protein